MIYLDNAATSFPKPESVIYEMTTCMKEYCANPGRGGHSLSLASLNAVMKTRELISNLFNISNVSRLCFTKNATEALNIGIKGFLSRGDHVVTTSMEHNSVVRPLKGLERDGVITLTTVEADLFGMIDANNIIDAIKPNTKMLIATFSSNVNGIILPIEKIGKICKTNSIKFFLDASQGAGSEKIDVDKFNINMLAFSGHKGLMGPQGTGGLYVENGIDLRPLIEGGTGSSSENIFQPYDMPELLESGTLNTLGIVGLGAGIEFIQKIGIDQIKEHKHYLVNRLINNISNIKGVKIYSKIEAILNSGIVAFNIEGVDSTEVAYVFDKIYNIAVRAGLHCSPLAHKTLGTVKSGVVRLSVGYFNTESEIDSTINAISEIATSL